MATMPGRSGKVTPQAPFSPSIDAGYLAIAKSAVPRGGAGSYGSDSR